MWLLTVLVPIVLPDLLLLHLLLFNGSLFKLTHHLLKGRRLRTCTLVGLDRRRHLHLNWFWHRHWLGSWHRHRGRHKHGHGGWLRHSLVNWLRHGHVMNCLTLSFLLLHHHLVVLVHQRTLLRLWLACHSWCTSGALRRKSNLLRLFLLGCLRVHFVMKLLKLLFFFLGSSLFDCKAFVFDFLLDLRELRENRHSLRQFSFFFNWFLHFFNRKRFGLTGHCLLQTKHVFWF